MYQFLFQINGKRGFAPKSFLNEYKVLKRDLSYEVPVYKYNDKANRVQPEKLESTEKKSSESQTLLKDKLSQNDNPETPLLKSIDESTIEESHGIDADSISPSYEVIDGTTVYFESKPSVQPSFVSEVAHATALPNEQTSVASDSEIAHEGLSSDKNTFINNKKIQSDTNNAKLEKIKLSVDTQKQTSFDSSLENPEAIIRSTLDTVNKNDTSALDRDDKSEQESLKNVEHVEKPDSKAEENVEDNKKEKITEHVESDGIFASITKTFKILSNLEETVTTESTTTQTNDDITVPEAVVSSDNLQLEEQVSENIEVKDVTEKTQVKLESSMDQSFTGKEKIEMQQEVIQKNIENIAKLSEEFEKIKETSTIILENITSSDVPLSNNFVHENVDKSAKELPAPLILTEDSSASAKADVDSQIKNIQIQETNKIDKVTENIRTDAITSDEEKSTISSNLQETVATTQSSNDIEQKLSESNEAYLGNIKKDTDYKEIIDQVDKSVIAETINLPSEAENIAIESFSESHSVDENIAITEEKLTHSDADIQFNKESIVYSNINKNDDLVNDTSSDKVPIDSNEFSNNVKSSILGAEQSIDSSQESIISEQTMILDEVLKKRDLSSIENLEHEDSKLLINIRKDKEKKF